MNRTQLACYAMLASSFVLGGLLISRLPSAPAAHAEEVVSKDTITAMTAATKAGEEALFVLDNNSQMLLIYRLDLGKKRLMGPVRMNVGVAGQAGATGGGGGNRGSR
jgi:hypothetical protein